MFKINRNILLKMIQNCLLLRHGTLFVKCPVLFPQLNNPNEKFVKLAALANVKV